MARGGGRPAGQGLLTSACDGTDLPMTASCEAGAVRERLDALWRIDGARIVAALTRVTGDVGFAEDLAQEAVAAALDQWPAEGVPGNPAAWLTTVAKRRAIDAWRRDERRQEHDRQLARTLPEPEDAAWDPVPDDTLRLVFVACHPVLARQAQVALTLRVVGGLTTEEIARLFLAPVATVQQRIVRAKRTLGEARVPFEVPESHEWGERLSAVLGVAYLMFSEGYAATSGPEWIRPDLAAEALRLGRVLTSLVPRESEAHALVALMELQASRFAARTGEDGAPVLLADQDRSRWDHAQIRRGLRSLERADELNRGRGPYALQAAIAACHATAPRVEDTDWDRIVLLYEALCRLSPSPVVELNRAVAVSMAEGPGRALAIADTLVGHRAFRHSHLLPSVRGQLLEQLGRIEEARHEFGIAAARTRNDREREVLQRRAARR